MRAYGIIITIKINNENINKWYVRNGGVDCNNISILFMGRIQKKK